MRDFFRRCLRLVTRPINFGAGKFIKSSDEPRIAIPDEGDLGGNGALSSMAYRLHGFLLGSDWVLVCQCLSTPKLMWFSSLDLHHQCVYVYLWFSRLVLYVRVWFKSGRTMKQLGSSAAHKTLKKPGEGSVRGAETCTLDNSLVQIVWSSRIWVWCTLSMVPLSWATISFRTNFENKNVPDVRSTSSPICMTRTGHTRHQSSCSNVFVEHLRHNFSLLLR